jgi:hypothetical protein
MHVLQTLWCGKFGSTTRTRRWGEEDGRPLNGAARAATMVGGCEEECLDPMVTGLHGGGTLDQEAVTARNEKSRIGSATSVLGLGQTLTGT